MLFAHNMVSPQERDIWVQTAETERDSSGQ